MLPIAKIFFLLVLFIQLNTAQSLWDDFHKQLENTIDHQKQDFILTVLDGLIKKNSEEAVPLAADALNISLEYEAKEKIPIQFRSAVIFENNGLYDLANELFTDIINNTDENYYLLESYLHSGSINKKWGNGEKVYDYYQKVLTISKRTNERKYEALALNRLGTLKKIKNELDSAMIYYNNSLVIFEELGNKKGIAKNYNDLGVLYKNYGTYEESYSYYSKAIDIYKEIKEDYCLSETFMHLAILHKNIKRYNKAKHFYEQSYRLRKKINDIEGQITLHIHLSKLEKLMLDYDEALEHLNKAQNLNKETLNSKKAESEIYVNRGQVLDKKEKFSEAINYFEKGLKIKQEMGEEIAVASILNFIGITEIKMGHEEKGLLKLIKVSDLLEKFNAHSQNVEVNYYIATLYESRNDHKNANIYLRKYLEVKEKLSNYEISKSLSQTNLELELEKKDRKLKEAEIEKQVNTRNFLIAISSLVLILLILMYSRYRAGLKTSKLLQQKNDEIKLKNEELEQVIYVASHDIKSPLLNIQGFSQEIIRIIGEAVEDLENNNTKFELKRVKNTLESYILTYSQHIIRSSNKLNGLIERLLELSKVGNQELLIEDLNMDDLVDDVKKSFEYQLKENGIEFKAEKLHDIRGDYFQISQVFSNLIGNSIKYQSQKNNKIIKIYSETNDQYNYYNFEDNGIGISPDKLKKIFDVFYQTNKEYDGYGLGLAIIKKIVDKHEGKIEVESEEGVGTKFIVKLPKRQ